MTSQHSHTPSRERPIFVGFAGRMGSGKTSAANHLRTKYGFQYTRYSQVLQEWLSAATTDRNRLQTLGWDIMSGGQQAELNSRLMAGLDRSRSAAIDGLRHQVDFESLSSSFGGSFSLIFLEAAAERRFGRLRERFAEYAAFQKADLHPVEAHIDSLRDLARVTILNENSLESLYQQLDAWIMARGVKDQT